jgi:hypothetical protein
MAYTGGMNGYSTFQLKVSVTDSDGRFLSNQISVTGAGQEVCHYPDG